MNYINQEIATKGFYTKPLGFLYEPDNKTITNLERQVRVYRSHYSPTGYHVIEGLLRIDDEQPGDNSLWLTIEEHELSSIDEVETFLSYIPSTY